MKLPINVTITKMLHTPAWDNTKHRAGQAGKLCFQLKNMDFQQVAQHSMLAGCRKGRADSLQNRADRR